MATITPINSWPVPTSADYVKDGASAIESLGDAIDASVGSGLLAWQTWAPTLSGGWANGNGTWSQAKYCQIGKTVFASGFFQLGSTTTKGTQLLISLPVNFNSATPHIDNSVRLEAGVGGFVGFVTIASTSTIQLHAISAAGTYAQRSTITTAIPDTWVTGNTFNFAIVYQGV